MSGKDCCRLTTSPAEGCNDYQCHVSSCQSDCQIYHVSRVSKFDIFSWRETETFKNFLQLSTLCSLLSCIRWSSLQSQALSWLGSGRTLAFARNARWPGNSWKLWHRIGETGETGSNSQATAKPEWYHSIWVEEPSELEWDVTPRRCSKAIHGITRKVSSEIALPKNVV